jgi:hypothetical protein
MLALTDEQLLVDGLAKSKPKPKPKPKAKRKYKSTHPCQHGRRKSLCKQDCGTGYCQHGHLKSLCKDCGTGCLLPVRTGARRACARTAARRTSASTSAARAGTGTAHRT